MKNSKNITLIVLLILSLFVIGCGLFSNFSTNSSAPEPSIETIPTEVPVEETISVPDETPSSEEKTIFIGPHQIECVGVAPQLCYQFKENPDDDWLLFYDQIDGFSWEENFIYELRVTIHQVENPPADGSSQRYELVELVNKEAYMPEITVPYIEITSPSDGDILNPTQAVVIRGMGAGLFEGNVVVQITDMDGIVLIKQPTVQQAEEFGGEGPWSIELNFEGVSISEGTITAFSPSPKDGSWIASDSISVKFAKPTGDAFTLEGPNWLLVAFADESLNDLLAENQVTMNLDPERGTAAGNAACNNYFTSYEIEGQKLILGPVGSTMMMCSEPQMTVEGAFLSALAEVAGYQIEENELILTNDAGEMVLVFIAD
jgi:heat shock protein HslJ